MEKKLSVVGIDIAKQVFHLVGMDEHGTILMRKRLYRAQVMAFIAQLPPTLIGMEACGGTHDWARRFRAHGGVGKELCNFPDGTDNWLTSGVLQHTPCLAPQPYRRCSLGPCV